MTGTMRRLPNRSKAALLLRFTEELERADVSRATTRRLLRMANRLSGGDGIPQAELDELLTSVLGVR
jgi:hypothetical protein